MGRNLTVVWGKMAVPRVTVKAENNNGVEVTEDVILKRGDVLPDFISEELASIYVGIGAVRDIAQLTDAVRDAWGGRAPGADTPPVGDGPGDTTVSKPPTPDPAAPASFGDIPDVGHPATPTDDFGIPMPFIPDAEPKLVDKPKASESKAAWEDYAVDGLPDGKRMARADAESRTKADLIAEVNRRDT